MKIEDEYDEAKKTLRKIESIVEEFLFFKYPVIDFDFEKPQDDTARFACRIKDHIETFFDHIS